MTEARTPEPPTPNANPHKKKGRPKYGDERTVALVVHLPHDLKELIRRDSLNQKALAGDAEACSMSSLVCALAARGYKYKLPKPSRGAS